MATITITYTKPEAPAVGEIASICPVFEPVGSYADMPAYDGTAYDTNVKGFGEWEGLEKYIGGISMHPGILLMFKAAMAEGEAEFEEADPRVIEYYKEVGKELAASGFAVTVAAA